MARTNADCGAWVAGLLKVTANDRVLEVGCGPGVVLQRLAQLAAAGHVAGIDQSRAVFALDITDLLQASVKCGAEGRFGRIGGW